MKETFRGMGGRRLVGVAVAVLQLSSLSAAAQLPYEEAIRNLASPDTGTRLKTVRLLKDAAYLEAAVPLARLVMDPDDDVQIEAIAAELNIFLVEKVVTRKRVGLVIEVRNQLSAESTFATGPSAIGAKPVPAEVLNALLAAARDDNPRVRLEAVYAFGVLGVEPNGDRRREMLRGSGPDLAAMIGAVDPAQRYAALRVIARLFERRPDDGPVDQSVGDAVISALNEKDVPMRLAAMQALGVMRYERAVQGLLDLYQYFGKGELAEVALDAVARVAHPSSASQLQPLLMSKDPALRGIAVEGLARIGDRTRQPEIQSALRGERNESLMLAGNFAALLFASSASDQVGLMAPLVAALAKPRLRDQARGYLTEAAAGRAQAFSRYLAEPAAVARMDLVDALGFGGDSAAIPVVETMSGDRDVRVARAAERALARLRQIRSGV